jgi:protoheme IX farnesyltransferase
MVAVTYLPFLISMCGLIYVVGVTLLNAGFLFYAIRLFRSKGTEHAYATFHYSIFYLMMLFLVLLADHYIPLFF